jgi:hypothetical protein
MVAALLLMHTIAAVTVAGLLTTLAAKASGD